MKLKLLKPKQALNKAYLKEKVVRSAIDNFNNHFKTFLQNTSANKSDEEHLKAQIAYFLRDTYYKDVALINPIKKNDLVIHNGKLNTDSVGIIIEVKSLTNKAEMLFTDKPNAKALHELVLYYLRQRFRENNNKIKYLIATNIDEWFLFDANEFDKKIYRNVAIKNLYDTQQKEGKDNPWFYDELKKTLETQNLELEVTHFNIRDFEKAALNQNDKDDKKLIAIYKLLSPVHLLKLPFANDSNSLQPKFYAELLHLIGLTEVKEGSKKLIHRKKEGERDLGSLLENTIIELDSHDKISRLQKPSAFGDNHQERLFNVALELVITWVNRILFLKLLEAQLVSYHKGATAYRFLNKEKIKDFDDLDKLFFRVLAKKPEDRNEAIQSLFGKVPYLNSSLFEPTELEHQTLFIHGLEDRVPLAIISSTVLKDQHGKNLKGNLDTIDYLFAFLDAYDFSSEGAEAIQEDNKTLINASVLGLIFEKINGYKDGSFFTPGFITMYMCRETIRRAVVQKFNETKDWNLKEYDELYNKIEDINEANSLINSLKICDPAVGSGHFLVSALNEMIAIKSDLNILCDRQGRRLKEYQVIVENDELIVADEDGEPFEYNPNNKESQRVQEALFHEKQTIIENCLFGVDINPNSVKICRLRLWIELLKNAYYREPEIQKLNAENDKRIKPSALSFERNLETLPNIDINIKTGNSLISRFALDADLKQALKKSKFSIDAYKIAVQTYRNAKDKEEKREMERLITKIKNDFRSEIGKNDPKLLKLSKIGGELFNLTNQQQLFGESKSEAKTRKAKIEKLEKEVNSLNTEVEEIKSNKIYENAFEWRFEFPDVLNDEGDFIGFDVVIGNPPYKMIQPNNTSINDLDYFRKTFPVSDFKIDLFHLFYQIGEFLLKKNGELCFITPSSILNNVYASNLRAFITKHFTVKTIAVTKNKIFQEADVHTGIFHFLKGVNQTEKGLINLTAELEDIIEGKKEFRQISHNHFSNQSNDNWNLLIDERNYSIFKRLFSFPPLGSIMKLNRGLITGDRDSFFSEKKETEKHIKILTGSDIKRFDHNESKEFVLFDKPKSAGGCWDSEVHLAPFKVCIRQIGSSPIATLIDYPCAVTGNIFTITYPKIEKLKFVLGIINSSLLKYFWKTSFNDFKTSFPQVTINSLNSIPIVESNISVEKEIANGVNSIINLKKDNPEEDTSTLEKEIDQLVYELYGLTEEEIAIVESA
jgi:tRNA1(Val) A37 N6-methylase TrmN6